jgi:hypothetical protein
MEPEYNAEAETLLRGELVSLGWGDHDGYRLRDALARRLGCEVVLSFDADEGWYLWVSETQRQKALDRATRR